MDDISFWLVAVAVILIICYAMLIAFYSKGWQRLPEYNIPVDFIPSQKVTVIIPARNEEANIGTCIQSLAAQDYPAGLLQVIVIDDHSTDATADIVKSFDDPRIQVLHLKDFVQSGINSYKKKAIATGIEHASGDWIITTDADCTASPAWIRSVMAYQQQTDAVLVAAPVKLKSGNRILHIFQSLDFLTLQGITAASVARDFHTMCNGANLCYAKQAFHDVNGFEGIDQLASGDDMLLMYKIAKQFPGKIKYLKSKAATVSSLPAESWKAFWSQRIRWASKADKYDDKRIFRTLVLVYLLNVLMLALFVLAFFNTDLFLVVILLLLSKTLIEYPFVNTVAAFFGERKLMKFFPLLQPLHILYTIIAGWLGKFGGYQWKGRTVR